MPTHERKNHLTYQNMRFIIKYKDEDGKLQAYGCDRINEVTAKMKRLAAYNKYFEVIHNEE